MFSITVPNFVGRGVNLWLGFAAQVDGLGVTAALKVERAAIGPAMFIIANQRAVRVSRQRGFTRADRPKKTAVSTGLPLAWLAEQCIGMIPFSATSSSAGKDGFLIFARVFCAANQDQLFLKVHCDDGFRAAVVPLGISLKAWAVDHVKSA